MNAVEVIEPDFTIVAHPARRCPHDGKNGPALAVNQYGIECYYLFCEHCHPKPGQHVECGDWTLEIL